MQANLTLARISKSHTILINFRCCSGKCTDLFCIFFYIVENCYRTHVINFIRKCIHVSIKLGFINRFVTLFCILHARENSSLTILICNSDCRTIFFATNLDNLCLFIPLNKAITFYIGDIVFNIRERCTNISKSFCNSSILLLFFSTIILNSLNRECRSGPCSTLILGATA